MSPGPAGPEARPAMSIWRVAREGPRGPHPQRAFPVTSAGSIWPPAMPSELPVSMASCSLPREERRVLCSGGVFATVDLSLHLVEKSCGREVAGAPCGWRCRALTSPATPCCPCHEPHDGTPIREVERYMAEHNHRDLPLKVLSARPRAIARPPRPVSTAVDPLRPLPPGGSPLANAGALRSLQGLP